MWKKLICWLYGHETVHKAFTGNTITSTSLLVGGEMISACYKWERTPFCTRCGVDVSVQDQPRVRGGYQPVSNGQPEIPPPKVK